MQGSNHASQNSVNTPMVDVAIVGGGLAGLTLAIHLRQRNPELVVHVVERRAHPVREAAFKVGESTVEIGAHYLAEVLGLREHLDSCHLRKFGFRFFFSEGRMDIDRCTEIGVSRVLPTPSWQIDRGRLENFLGDHAIKLGVRFESGATVRKIELQDIDRHHRIEFDRDGERRLLTARWVVDASGRAGLLKRKLGLARPNKHDANGVWWRVTGHIDPNDWSDDVDWLQRCTPSDRWRSTNHMCGPGYWVWLIPLASGSHSVGIVCDAKMHPLDGMNTHEKAMDWLRRHQPRVAMALAHEKHALQDFMFLRDFSYGCAQVFSEQRWAITGEAGLFLDPFYSPGTDFIAIANTYICDLVERDIGNQPFAVRAQIYQQLFSSFYDNTLPLYEGQYSLFGDSQVMPVKVIWDYTYYWALLAPIFFAQRLTDVAALSRLRDSFAQARKVNLRMQAFFADWGRRNQASSFADRPMLDQHGIAWFHEMNRVLADAHKDAEFEALIVRNVRCMCALSKEILLRGNKIQSAIEREGSFPDSLQTSDSSPGAHLLLQPEWYARTV